MMSSIVTRPDELAVLVDDESEPLAVGLELLQLGQQRRAGRHEIRRAQDRAELLRPDVPAVLQVHDLFQMDDADDVVELRLVGRQARVVGRRELLRDQRGLGGEVERVDLVARRHHVVDGDRLEVEQVGEHGAVLAAEVLALQHERAQFLLRQRRAGVARALDAQQLQQALDEQVDEPDDRSEPPSASAPARSSTTGAMRSACAAPTTLGVISENTRIRKVTTSGAERQRELALAEHPLGDHGGDRGRAGVDQVVAEQDDAEQRVGLARAARARAWRRARRAARGGGGGSG